MLQNGCKKEMSKDIRYKKTFFLSNIANTSGYLNLEGCGRGLQIKLAMAPLLKITDFSKLGLAA